VTAAVGWGPAAGREPVAEDALFRAMSAGASSGGAAVGPAKAGHYVRVSFVLVKRSAVYDADWPARWGYLTH
jgi:hypothetical protein